VKKSEAHNSVHSQVDEMETFTPMNSTGADMQIITVPKVRIGYHNANHDLLNIQVSDPTRQEERKPFEGEKFVPTFSKLYKKLNEELDA
jgi:hypothetical protein